MVKVNYLYLSTLQYFVQPLNHCVWDQTAEDKETYCKGNEIVKSAQALKDVVSLVYLFPMSQLPLVSRGIRSFWNDTCSKMPQGACRQVSLPIGYSW